ncbi:DUF3099 domain-containing protein [Catenulispora rubra]|uniref:DUF3099 domain-containing protein n=1 Tax=Catenulispora rubra TaxID=280293 RepID=UPI00189243B7|nr:DUF3099 domain-containing protein [Catenulispora rubra]
MRIGRDKSGHRQDVVHGITDAPKPLSQDIRSRESKYLMAMGIRVAAFLLIVILPIAWPWKIGLAVLALVLPYVAVVYANGGREPEPGADSPFTHAERQALLPGQSGRNTASDHSGDPRDNDGSAPDEPIVGRIVGDDD